MDNEMNTNNTMNTVPPSPGTNLNPTPPVKKSKAKKVLLWLLVVIIMLALGAGAGYMVGQMNKKQEVDTAKTAGKQEGMKQGTSDTKPEAQKIPAKTVTETTCNADELSLATEANNESGAGTLSYNIVLTNMGNRACILGGYPGVSLVNNNGNQIGSPAERTENSEEKTLTLQPNDKVMAAVYTSNEDNFEPGQCTEGATKLRVYPPNDVGYLSVATQTTAWCPGFEVSPVMEM